jgi:hypothetical protein
MAMSSLCESGIPKPPVLLRLASLLFVAAFALTNCGSAPNQGPTLQGTSHSVTLSWVADASAVSGYAVYRSSGDPTGPFYPLAITLPGTTQFIDTTVVTGETYYYTVTAFDSSNLQSLPTFAVTASIPSN